MHESLSYTPVTFFRIDAGRYQCQRVGRSDLAPCGRDVSDDVIVSVDDDEGQGWEPGTVGMELVEEDLRGDIGEQGLDRLGVAREFASDDHRSSVKR